jgi:hypothetical protein
MLSTTTAESRMPSPTSRRSSSIVTTPLDTETSTRRKSVTPASTSRPSPPGVKVSTPDGMSV